MSRPLIRASEWGSLTFWLTVNGPHHTLKIAETRGWGGGGGADVPQEPYHHGSRRSSHLVEGVGVGLGVEGQMYPSGQKSRTSGDWTPTTVLVDIFAGKSESVFLCGLNIKNE